MRDKPTFWVDMFFGAVCLGIALSLWGCISTVVAGNLFDAQSPEQYGVWLVLVVNALHFFLGWFHAKDDLSDVAPEKRGLMAKAWESDRMEIRVLAILTIGCSAYWRAALENHRWKDKKLKHETSTSE